MPKPELSQGESTYLPGARTSSPHSAGGASFESITFAPRAQSGRDVRAPSEPLPLCAINMGPANLVGHRTV